MVCAHVLSDRIEMKPIGGLRSEHVSDIVVEQRVKCARNPFLVEPWGARAGSRDLHQTHVDQRLGIFDARSESDPAANHALKIALEHCRRGAEPNRIRSEEHTSELQSLMRISYAVFCLKKKKKIARNTP